MHLINQEVGVRRFREGRSQVPTMSVIFGAGIAMNGFIPFKSFMSKRYALTLGAVFGLISVITTLGVHLIVIPVNTFEESVHLFDNTTYLFSKGLIIFHCLAVFMAMGGVFVALNTPHNLNARLGLISFSIFSWTEITRMVMALTYLRHLRQSYLEQTESLLKSAVRLDIENFNYIGEGLFVIFMLGFALGNLFYGLELIQQTGLGKVVGYLLVIWSITGFMGAMTAFYPVEGLDDFFKIYNVSYQPIVRGLTAYWLIVQVVAMGKVATSNNLRP